MPKPIFVTGIDTGVGKTIVSAILVENLQADYWKPIQSGDLENSDTAVVRYMVKNTKSVFHEEAYRLSKPYSPHKSASLDGVTIELAKINIPETENQLIIEGAGGLMVPLNDKDFIIDLIKKFDAQVVLVVKHYLGSINHTLLAINTLRAYDIVIKEIVFNGLSDEYSEAIIIKYANVPYSHQPLITL